MVKKSVDIVTWIALVVTGILLLFSWEAMSPIVGTHLNLLGEIDRYGDKSTLVIFYIFIIIINAVYTLGYDMPTDKILRFPKKYAYGISLGIRLLCIFACVAFIIARIFT